MICLLSTIHGCFTLIYTCSLYCSRYSYLITSTSSLREGVNKQKGKKRKPKIPESASLQAEAATKAAAAAAVASLPVPPVGRTKERGSHSRNPSSKIGSGSSSTPSNESRGSHSSNNNTRRTDKPASSNAGSPGELPSVDEESKSTRPRLGPSSNMRYVSM